VPDRTGKKIHFERRRRSVTLLAAHTSGMVVSAQAFRFTTVRLSIPKNHTSSPTFEQVRQNTHAPRQASTPIQRYSTSAPATTKSTVAATYRRRPLCSRSVISAATTRSVNRILSGHQTCLSTTVRLSATDDWDLDLDDLYWRPPYLAPARRTLPKLVHKILFSMPAGTPPTDF
jgi:hypothetical protein